MKLTTAKIRALEVKAQRYSVSDGGGLDLFVRPSGRKVWVYRWMLAGRRGWMTLATWPRMSLNAARARRVKYEQMVANGESPADYERRERNKPDARITLREFGARFVAEVVAKVRRRPETVTRYLERDVYPKLGNLAVVAVTGDDVQRLIFARRDGCPQDGLKARPEAAAQLRHLLKRIFDYARVCGLVTANPVDQTPLRFVTRHKRRERVLSESELRQFLHRVKDVRLGACGTALELLLLTMVRKSELRLARWDEFETDVVVDSMVVSNVSQTWNIPAEHTKTGKAHVVYLSRQAVVLLEHLRGLAGKAERVLPGRDSLIEPMNENAINKAMARIKWGIPHFTVHDLRRTASTILNEKGYNADWIEAALGHTKGGVRAVYNKAQYAEQRRKMLQEWADWLDEVRNAE